MSIFLLRLYETYNVGEPPAGYMDVFLNIVGMDSPKKVSSHFNVLLYYLHTYLFLGVALDNFHPLKMDRLRASYMDILHECSERWPRTYMNIMYCVYRHYYTQIVDLEDTRCRIDTETFQELIHMARWATSYGPATLLKNGEDIDTLPLFEALEFTYTVWNR